MTTNSVVTDLKQVTIRFSGDSGDGMQLSGTLFSTLSAIFGNEISTFPDYPAEIRAPQGTFKYALALRTFTTREIRQMYWLP